MIQTQGNNLDNAVNANRRKRYERFCNGAIEYQKKKDIHRMALCLYVLQSEKLFVEGGYTNIYELGMKLLNVSRGTVSGYVQIAKKFLDSNTGKSIFANDSGDFSYFQLTALKKLKPDDVKELLSTGKITFNTTEKEIKQAVAAYLTDKKQEEAEAKEEAVKPIKDAYEAFHKAYNELEKRVGDDTDNKALLQSIMDSVVVLYNENDRLWN